MLSDLQDEPLSLSSSPDLESVEDGGKLVGELNIDNSTNNGNDLSLVYLRGKGTDSVGIVTSDSATLSKEPR